MPTEQELDILSTMPMAGAFAVALGLLWGSFANVCIYRWPPTDEHPHGRSVTVPGSHCSTCKTPIRWYDNVPLLSWLWLRGRCRACKTPFSAHYLLVEALTGALFGVAWWMAFVPTSLWEPVSVRGLRFVILAAFCFVMVVVAFIDLDHKLILNKVTVPSMIVFYGLGLLVPGHAWYDGLVGAAIGWGLPWLIGEIYFRVTGREGMGLGDGMLLAVVGALLGWQGVVVALFGGSVIGSVIGIGALAATRARKGRGDDSTAPGDPDADDPGIMRAELPFGPFLAIAATFYAFAEPWITLRFAL